MYFADRIQAGRMLAKELAPKYRYENSAVVALNNGGVIVGAQIAVALHCSLNLLVSRDINLPRELEAIGSIAQDGSFTYSQSISVLERNEMVSEFRQYIEQEKMSKLHEINRLIGDGGTIRKDLLRGRNIILVSDGFMTGSLLDVAVQFLKPIATEKLIVATPLAGVPAVDYMHVLTDEIYCLSVIGDTFGIDHYYDNNDIPDEKKVVDIISHIILNWR